MRILVLALLLGVTLVQHFYFRRRISYDLT